MHSHRGEVGRTENKGNMPRNNAKAHREYKNAHDKYVEAHNAGNEQEIMKYAIIMRDLTKQSVLFMLSDSTVEWLKDLL